jgi:hypothetical protein
MSGGRLVVRIGRQSNFDGSGEALQNFADACRAHNRGSLLPFGEFFRALAIDIDPGEFLPIVVVDGDLPVSMLSPGIPGNMSRFAHGLPFLLDRPIALGMRPSVPSGSGTIPLVRGLIKFKKEMECCFLLHRDQSLESFTEA